MLKRKPALVAARSFILSLERAEMGVYPAVGLGMDVRATAHGVVAVGLVERERVVHLVGFTAPVETRRHDSDEDELARSIQIVSPKGIRPEGLLKRVRSWPCVENAWIASTPSPAFR